MTFGTGLLRSAFLAGLGVAAVTGPTQALAETPMEFFKGKQITMTMGTRPGGSFQVYAQALIAHMP